MKLFEGPGLIILLVIVLIIFGPKQLPQLGKSLGKTMKSIREGTEDDSDEATGAKIQAKPTDKNDSHPSGAEKASHEA